jgi:predicted CxxxxCH...CXXCH cytochrome family protein
MRAQIARAALLAVIAACSQARPLENDVRPAVSWREDVSPLFTQRCVGCHSGATPAAGYDASTYLGAIGVQPAVTPTVVTEGDPNSLLLTVLNPATADAIHAQVAGLVFPTVSAWVVAGRLSFFRSELHAGGILNPADPDFHGQLLKNLSWNFSACANCHGADYTGGTSGVSCTQCHTQVGGPTACTTCHGQPPQTGAHLVHVAGSVLARPLDCSECHVKPASWDDPGHLFNADGSERTVGQVTFGTLAGTATPQRTAAPSWSHEAATCSNVYCHGGAFTDSKATAPAPSWNGGHADGSCGSCHGLPPASHGNTNVACAACHPNVSGGAGAPVVLTSNATHIDGVIQVGDGTGACNSCHGSAASPAPPRDLEGNTDTSAIGVGAHQAHLTAAHGISAPVACSACHLVPAAVNSPGHLDGSLPATLTFQGIAISDGATPAYNHATATCSNVYCHGGGNTLAGDTSANLFRTPVWTGGSENIACGSCHGLPPKDTNHAATLTLLDCYQCHPSTIDKTGAIIVSGSPGAATSTHINGVVDVTAP